MSKYKVTQYGMGDTVVEADSYDVHRGEASFWVESVDRTTPLRRVAYFCEVYSVIELSE